MRAISSFKREAGISTFWCRAWSAFRTRVSMSATGSVNLIVCFSSSHPFAPRRARRTCGSIFLHPTLVTLNETLGSNHPRLLRANKSRAWPASLPRRLRNPWNLPAQRELPEAESANAELAQERAWAAAQFAAIVPARRELGPRLLVIARFLKRFLNLCVFDSFCCRHAILRKILSLTRIRNP